MEFILIYSYKIKKITVSSFPKIILYSSLIISIFFYAENQGAFNRFEDVISYDIGDDENMMYATGGRWQELLGIITHHNEKPYRWFVGSGFGGRYIWTFPLSNYYELKHYAHFAPLSYVFIFGIPFMIMLYLLFTFYIIKSIKYISNPFVILFIIGVFSSFFGANLFIDIKLWVFFGMVLHILKNPSSELSNLKIFNYKYEK